jgi:hypothetical protein
MNDDGPKVREGSFSASVAIWNTIDIAGTRQRHNFL